MKFVCISDVHIKEPNDLQANLFKKFLNSPQTKNADTIFLLGDIFDLVVGGQNEYLKKYSELFEMIASLAKNNKKVIMFEGNHDFHFGRLVLKACKKWHIPDGQWQHRTEPLRLEINGVPTLFAHGDEIEIENPSYQSYRAFIRSYPIYFLSNYIVPQFIVDKIGTNASKKSRERNLERYGNDNNDEVKEKFHRVFKQAQSDFDIKNLVCGHSHCRDFFESDGYYLNNGFFPVTKTFTYFDGQNYSQVTLDAS